MTQARNAISAISTPPQTRLSALDFGSPESCFDHRFTTDGLFARDVQMALRAPSSLDYVGVTDGQQTRHQ